LVGLRKSWYLGGPITDLKYRYVFPLVDSTAPTSVIYRGEANAKAERVERMLNEYLPPQVRGLPNALNWKILPLPGNTGMAPELTGPKQALRKIASIKSTSSTPFARFLPDLGIALVRGKDGHTRLYSLVRNREHANVSWMFGESERLALQEDSLSVRAGVLGAYPNMFFVVPEPEIDLFSSTVARVKSAADYERLVDNFGVRRSNENFWSVYDAINATHVASDPVRSRILDFTRCGLEDKSRGRFDQGVSEYWPRSSHLQYETNDLADDATASRCAVGLIMQNVIRRAPPF
jgi:hypothetical protein